MDPIPVAHSPGGLLGVCQYARNWGRAPGIPPLSFAWPSTLAISHGHVAVPCSGAHSHCGICLWLTVLSHACQVFATGCFGLLWALSGEGFLIWRPLLAYFVLSGRSGEVEIGRAARGPQLWKPCHRLSLIMGVVSKCYVETWGEQKAKLTIGSRRASQSLAIPV